MTNGTQEHILNLDDVINLDIGDIEQTKRAIEILTLLPTKAFILAVFTLIILLASPGILEALPEQDRTWIFLLILFVISGVGLYLWRSSSQYKKYSYLMKRKSKKTEVILRDLHKRYLDIQKSNLELSQIIQDVKNIKQNLSTSLEGDTDAVINKILSRLESHRKNLDSILLFSSFNSLTQTTDEEAERLTDSMMNLLKED